MLWGYYIWTGLIVNQGSLHPPQNTFPELNKGEKKRFLSLLYACALHACYSHWSTLSKNIYIVTKNYLV